MFTNNTSVSNVLEIRHTHTHIHSNLKYETYLFGFVGEAMNEVSDEGSSLSVELERSSRSQRARRSIEEL
jgi:hypothetical protein